MKTGKWILVLLFAGLIVFPLVAIAAQPEKFPSNENLAKRNAALHMVGFTFVGGLARNEKSQPNCNGLDTRIIEWDGSGFVVSEDGTIVTNYHVASKALTGKAKFQDGSTYEIRNIKVYDPVSDIAILKISGEKRFPVVNLGDSDTLQPQERVLAVGNPLAMGINITEGMVSQVPRDDNGKPIWIRHTAQIAPGNSGGALYKGNKVVGVNESVNLALQGYTSLSGFNNAVPINKVKRLLENPTYANRIIPLVSAFPGLKMSGEQYAVDFEGIVSKAKQIYATNGQVQAASGNTPGVKSIPFEFFGLEDLLIIVKSSDRTLDLLVANPAGGTVGCGFLQSNDNVQPLLISSENHQNVLIGVLNYGETPADFGLGVYKIEW